MVTGYEVKMFQDISLIGRELKRIADTLEKLAEVVAESSVQGPDPATAVACDHCHDDPPVGHICPKCGRKANDLVRA